MTTSNELSTKLHDFTNSNSHFTIIYKTTPTPITHHTSTLHILDSSFNPPHLGHLSLLSKSLKRSIPITQTTELQDPQTSQDSVLLLLSIKNADKAPQPESFVNRLIMICKMANYVKEKYDHVQNVSVALTKYAKFVDKSDVIREWVDGIISKEYVGNLNKNIKFSFLVGFDTLIRVFDPKYYHPDGINEALGQFMKYNDFFCLTRGVDEDQRGYVQKIKNGEMGLPRDWAEKIHLIEGDEKFLHISSSDIRKKIQLQQETGWENYVISSIVEFIKNEKLYTTTS